jgi:hypothetical protein
MLRAIAAAGAAWILSLVATPAFGTAYLVGAQLYSCTADGTNGGGPFGAVYQYSTNSATIHQPLGLSGPDAFPFALGAGANPISFDTGGVDPGDYACMNLFFDDADVRFDPPYDPEAPVPGDLVVIAPVDGAGFAFPAAGVVVQSFNSTGSSVIAAEYSGATSFEVGGQTLTVSAFTVNASIDGSFTIEAPEPGTGAAAVAAAFALLGVRRAAG